MLGPLPSEQVHDPQFEWLVDNICARPQMYVTPATFGAVCAYLSGFDAARNGGPLVGLHPWLVVRAGDGNSLGPVDVPGFCPTTTWVRF
jgi:hypothetical protein